ncbi:MAG: hypothetical protein FJZ05_01035 [Candidatus Nealsonbacteria bacterium]|nr:hypothetical protein [Candidatus Nealsonbacteria bacterium]
MPVASAIGTALAGALSGFLGLIFNVLGTITGALLWLAVSVFNLVISPDFITVAGEPISYTDPSKNPFIAIGWELTRDFSNIIIVLALVVIGLGTALRLTGYQAQKTLPALILIALLINFTPIICGLVVDAANILMNFFTKEGFAAGNSFINMTTSQWANIRALTGTKLYDPISSNKAIAAAVASLMIVVFNLVASLIYLVFAFLLTLRYIAIWVIVILSPLAFVSYILPDTRKLWHDWWKQLIQWSFIGVVAAFFLYLSDHMLWATKSILFESAKDVGSAPGLAQIFNNIMPYGIVIVFLVIGLQLSLSSSAAGAKGALNFVQKSGKTVGGWAGKRSLAFARDKTPEGVRRWAERQAAAKKWGEGEKGIKGALKRAASDPLTRARRGMGGLMVSGFNEKLDTGKSYETAKKQDTAKNLEDYRKAISEAEKAGTMKAMVEKGQLNDALDKSKFGNSALTEGELLKTYEKAAKMGDFDTIGGIERSLVNNPEAVANFAGILHKMDRNKYDENGLTKEDRLEYKNYRHKIMGGVRTADDMKQLQKGWYDNEDLMEYANSSFGAHQITQAAMVHGKSFTDKFTNFAQRRGPDWYTEVIKREDGSYKMRNAGAIQFLSSNGAMSLGIGVTSFNQNNINRKVFAGRMVEQHPELGPVHAQYSAIQDMKKHIKREAKKGAYGPDLQQIGNAQVRIAEESLENKLNDLYGKNPDLEKEWDGFIERTEGVGKRKGRRNR